MRQSTPRPDAPSSIRNFVTRRIGTAVLALLALAAPALVRPAWAQSEAIFGLRPIGDYLLEVAGEPAPAAKFYAANNPPAILIVSSRFEAPVLIRPQTASVESVSVMKMAEQSGGTVDLLPGAVASSHGSFTVEGVDVKFTVGSTSALIKPKPPLTGDQGIEDLEAFSPDYARLAATYRPSPAIVNSLRETDRAVKVRVYFGTWCPFCGQMVPRVMRVASELEGSNVEIEFYGLPRDFSDDTQASRYGIKSVPTGVVFVDGAEAGRISGNSWKIPELALNKIVADS